jgi:hypothetical protein
MSAPAIQSSSSSVSSSGQVDGLGRRVLAFDRETGGMLERLYLRPELAAFEIVLRGYIERLAALEDDRFGRPLHLEHDAATGELTVVSQFVAGSRLSDLLDTAQDAGMAPGVDVALGYLLEALPAISTFHSKTGMTHGLIDPARTVVSARGQVVFLDCAFGPAIERLGLSAARLWNELGIAAPPSAGRVRLDATADIAQVAMSAVMLVHGRRLAPYEYPDSLPSILMEIVEVAQIRRSSTFASSLQRILQRSLPLPGRRAFGTADEAIVEVRQLVRREIGLDVCRQALADFVAQMDAASLTEPEIEEPFSAEAAFDAAMIAAGIQLVDEEGDEAFEDADSDDEASSELELELQLDAPTPEPASAAKPAEDVLAIPDVIEIDDVFDIDASDAIVPPFATTAPVSTPRPLDEWPDASPAAVSSSGQAEPATREPTPAPELSYASNSYEPEVETPAFVERSPAADAPHVRELAAALPVQTPPAPEAVPPPVEQPAPPSEPVRAAAWERTPAPAAAPAAALEQAAAAPLASSPEPAPALAPTPAIAPLVAEAAPSAPVPERPASAAAVQPPVSASAQPAPEQPADADGAENASSRRRKRQQRSARARKDKLRSLTTDQQIAGAKPAQPPAQKSGAWIVSPDRAAAFEQAVQEPAPATPVAPRPLVVPPAPTFPPPPPAPPLPPVASTPVVPVFNPPPTVQLQPKPIAPLSPPAIRPTPPPASGPLRLKSEPPSGYAPVRKRLAPDPPVDDRAFSAIPFAHSAEEEATRSFPWKLAGAALVLIAIAIVVGRAYIPSRATPDEAPETVATAAPADEPPATTASTTGGDIVIETQPAGVRVLLDGKPVGESPLKLPGVSAGRHVITFVTSSGEFKRTVRVAAGQTLNLDVPLYSGWVAIFAPIMLDVAENGRVIGNTEQNRLMLPPGAHKLTITNRELGYSTVKEVDIQAGEVYSVTLDPRGPVNFNAVPWGEVWLDNQKIGDTPIANFQVPLGVREFVFKHPQFGERRVTATVRADAPAAISVDFTKP